MTKCGLCKEKVWQKVALAGTSVTLRFHKCLLTMAVHKVGSIKQVREVEPSVPGSWVSS